MPSKVQDAAGSESSPKPPVTAESGAKSEAVQVAVRVRPLSANEASQGSETCLDVVNGSILLAEKQFDFDVTFPATSDQESVYTTLVAPMVDQFFAGYNATVLAYGQTGTGKTYTMGNEFASSVVPVERGVILRVVQDVFERVEASANPQHFVIRLSYLEILNEEIHDLLNVAKPEPNPPPKSTGLSQLEIVRLQLLQQTQSASSRPGRLTPQGFSAANGIVESTSGVSALEAENRKLKAELSLANNEKKKWKQIANELTDKNKNESEFAPSKAIGSHLDVSAPIKKHGAVNDGEYGKSGPLSRLEQLRKFQSHKVKSQHSKDDTAVKRKNGDYTPANMHTRTLMSPSTSTPDTESKILNARMALVLPSHIKRSRVGESAALIMGTITKLLQQVLASQESIYNAKVDVRVNLANRNALALEISQLEGSSSTENTERLARLRSDLRSKSANIRLLQQKLANVGKNVSLPSGLFPIRLETCHDLIRHLIETLVGFKEECMVLQSDAANERIMSQQEAHSKVQALGKRLKEALKEMQTLREQSTKKKAAKKRKARESYETMDTLFSSSSEEEDNTEADSDYVDEEVNRNEGNKRKRRCRTPVSEGSKRVDAMDEIDELLETSAATCCACYGKCATKACACKSQNRICNNECSCNSNKCQNRGGDDNTGESSGVVHDSDEVLGMTVSDVARSTPKRGAGDFASETSSSTTLMNPTVTTYTSPIIDLMSP
ncbi:Chromosome-associated kinesin KIF4 [Phytophthora ramorum]|uniref:Chromosome-associated kinesin KIF4 n=1 Tax=Phytophthora ramorum TaxID=164328 RepID=UPI00309D3496|nr:Chromosome-associated kinesin KIF4 [Phytophthora ramorum]